MAAKKKLNRLFIDKKIPTAARRAVPVIADEDSVLWAVGVRNSEHAHVTENTKKVLEIRAEGTGKNE